MHFSKSFDMKLQKYLRWTSIVQFQKIPTLPPWKVLFCTPPPPQEIPKFSKVKTFTFKTPLPPRNFQSPPVGWVWSFPGTAHYAFQQIVRHETSEIFVMDKHISMGRGEG